MSRAIDRHYAELSLSAKQRHHSADPFGWSRGEALGTKVRVLKDLLAKRNVAAKRLELSGGRELERYEFDREAHCVASFMHRQCGAPEPAAVQYDADTIRRQIRGDYAAWVMSIPMGKAHD